MSESDCKYLFFLLKAKGPSFYCHFYEKDLFDTQECNEGDCKHFSRIGEPDPTDADKAKEAEETEKLNKKLLKEDILEYLDSKLSEA